MQYAWAKGVCWCPDEEEEYLKLKEKPMATTAHSMQGKVCLITGANSGIGKATALGLANMGATIVLVCRDQHRGEAAQAEIKAQSGNESVDLLPADLASQASIRQLAAEVKARYPQVHVLINNAGVMPS